MARKPQKKWVWVQTKQIHKPTPLEKERVTQKFAPLIEEFKSKYIEPPHPEFNYRVDFYSKWYRHFFYLCTKYKSNSTRRLADEFEDKFIRLECVGPDRFDLAYMRHTGQWWPLNEGQTLDECLKHIQEDPWFQPF